ncbi:MAG: BON domain-containing protein [Pseudomonadota bacterium]
MNKTQSNTIGILFLALFLALSGCAATKTNESTGEFIDDSVITANVKSALLADKTTPGMSIEVETFKGRVQLSGFVDTAAQAKNAETVAARVKGVKSVINNIELKKDSPR